MKKYQFDLEKPLTSPSADASPIKNVVSEMLDKFKLKTKFKELSIAEAWRKVLGESVSRRTLQLSVRDRKVFVKLESAALKQEIMMNKSDIIARLNQFTQENLIEDLIFQ